MPEETVLQKESIPKEGASDIQALITLFKNLDQLVIVNDTTNIPSLPNDSDHEGIIIDRSGDTTKITPITGGTKDPEVAIQVNGKDLNDITNNNGKVDTLAKSTLGDLAEVNVGVEHPSYATPSDVPNTIKKGETVYIEQDNALYVEDGT